MRSVTVTMRTLAVLGVLGVAVSAAPAEAQQECSQCRPCPEEGLVRTQQDLPGYPVSYIVMGCEEYTCEEMLECDGEGGTEDLLAFMVGAEQEDVAALLALRQSRGDVWEVVAARRLLVLRGGCSAVPIATKRVSERMVAALLEAQ